MVDTTSASGGAVQALERPGRAVIAATKSGTEKNATVFARYWVEAFQDPSADTDKSDSISAMEAFTYADRKTAEFYDSQKRLATEHAVFNDTGTGEPVREAGKRAGHAAVQLHRAAPWHKPAGGQRSGEARAAGEEGRSGAEDRRAEVPESGDGSRRTTRSN